MPLYEFTDDQGLGVKVELIRPISERDKPVTITLKRRTVPTKMQVVGMNPTPNQADSVLKGYYRQEQKHGAKWKSKYTPEQIKKAWREP